MIKLFLIWLVLVIIVAVGLYTLPYWKKRLVAKVFKFIFILLAAGLFALGIMFLITSLTQ